MLDCLVREHVPVIIKKGFELLVSGDKIDDLQRMYSLFLSVDHLAQLRDAFEDYIKTEGAKVVLDQSRDRTMVVDLLTFKRKLDTILTGPFQKNRNFQFALYRSFEDFINRRANRPAELIAKYVDQKLKQGNKNASEEELEEDLDRAMELFKFINGKDVFEAFYKKDLAKRFLLNKSASEDAERLMIAKLKAECGTGFTQKLEGMFQDIELSKEVMEKYNKWRKGSSDDMDTSDDSPSSPSSSSSKPSSSSSKLAPAPSSQPSFDMGCHVLTTSSWPEYKAQHVKLPDEIEKEQNTFAKYYLGQHTGRKIKWMTPLTHCILGARFKSGRKELAVSAFQAVVLMLFNRKEILSYKEIRKWSELEDPELKRTLISLLSGKTREMRVLVKKPHSKEIDQNDQFKVNPNFKSQFYRVKVNSIQIKETKAENKRTNEQVHQDRMYQIDACIVRIMKSRKTMKHQLLIAAVFEQLKFPAQTIDLKRRIESLLARDYIERDEDDPQSYNYLA